MNLEKLLKLLNSDNISIQYSNVNGVEKLIVNGENLLDIKDKVEDFKKKIESLDDCVFEAVLDEAENRNFDIAKMNKSLELDNYTEEDIYYIESAIDFMSNIIREVISERIAYLEELRDKF